MQQVGGNGVLSCPDQGATAVCRTSRELLCVGGGDIQNKLLINSKLIKKNASSPIAAVPRSSLLGRVQDFLPKMAQANQKLQNEMATAPVNHFDIENIDDASADIIEMNVAVVELSGSEDSDAEEESSSEETGSESEDDWAIGEVTVDNIKLPKPSEKKGKIEILDSKNK
ncbi:NOP protein chaperone 1 [Pleurodeles waltl]|uniref:NOP protein chaperone 1 n=1 Tax=Pleurodeles waltl TaxID=8319 RepID=UPI00370967F9